MLYEICAGIYNKCMLIAQESIKFCRRIVWQSFLVNNFADFPDVVQVKNQDFVTVFVGLSLQQHLLSPYNTP